MTVSITGYQAHNDSFSCLFADSHADAKSMPDMYDLFRQTYYSLAPTHTTKNQVATAACLIAMEE